MGQVLCLRGRLIDAAAVYRSILDSDLTDTTAIPLWKYKTRNRILALEGLGEVRVLQGRFLDAAACFASIIVMQPTYMKARLQRGLALRSGIASRSVTGTPQSRLSGNSDNYHIWQEVEHALILAINLSPWTQNNSLMSSISVLAARAHLCNTAHITAKQAPDLFVPACLALGEAQEELNHPSRAVTTYELAVHFLLGNSNDGSNFMTNDKIIVDEKRDSFALIEPLYRLGRLHLSSEHFDAAAKCLKMAYDATMSISTTKTPFSSTLRDDVVTLASRQLDIKRLHSEALRKLAGCCAFIDGNVDKALGHLKLASELEPDSSEVPYLTGRVLLELCGNAKLAAAAERTALELDPNMAKAHITLASCQRVLGDYFDAVNSYRAGIFLMQKIDIEPPAGAFCGMGDSLAALARKAKETKESVSEDDAAIAYQMQALEAYQSAIDIDWYHGKALRGAGLCLLELKHFGLAVLNLKRASVLLMFKTDLQFSSAYGIALVSLLQRDENVKSQKNYHLEEITLPVLTLTVLPEVLKLPLSTEMAALLWEESKRALENVFHVTPKDMNYDACIALAAVRIKMEGNYSAAQLLIEQAIKIDVIYYIPSNSFAFL